MGQGRAAVAVVVVVAAFVIACSPASTSVEPVPAPLPVVTPKVPETKREIAIRGLRLFDEKKYDEAVPVLTEAAHLYPEVAPFLRLRIVEAEIERGNLQNAAAVASEIIALGDTSASTVARLRLPVIHARIGDAASTDRAWQQAMQVPIDELTEPDFVQMATALANAGRNDLATTTRMRLLNEYTQGRYTEQTYGFAKNEIEQLSNEEKLALAAKLSRANRYDQALELFEKIPAGEAEARAIRFRALFNSRNYGQLLEQTKDVKLGDPSLMLLRARAAWRNDQPQEFLAGLAQVEEEFPSSREAAEAKVVRAKYYVTDEIDHAKAITDLSKAIDAGALGADGENIWNLGWTYLLAGRHDEALATFDRYVKAYPDGDWKTNSLFWSAKLFDRLGRNAERDVKAQQIVDEFPYSYYAYRARELWKVEGPKAAAPQMFPDWEAELAKVDEPRFATVHELLEINLNRWAAREMKVLAAKHAANPGVQFMLADVYVRAGEPLKANGVLQRQFRTFVRHGGANIPRRFWEILFPLPYWETIRTEAQRRGLDPYLVASIIRQESAFEPSTVSNAGAVGLMQIMPEEAARIGSAAGLGEVTRESLFDPLTNIAVGAAEYSQKLAAMNGDHVLAIASYNAGEAAVSEWLQRMPIDDVDSFVEAIPYAETRLYVKTVTRNRHEYRRIYEGVAAAPSM